jgi:hypothetical protein
MRKPCEQRSSLADMHRTNCIPESTSARLNNCIDHGDAGNQPVTEIGDMHR